MEKELPLYPHNDETHIGSPPTLPPVAHVCLKSLVSLPVTEGPYSTLYIVVRCNYSITAVDFVYFPSDSMQYSKGYIYQPNAKY